ncbi:MAG: insulinase family protein [Lachnospiraceae bacterium]|nr:insulinase family protein [Lachnospiraceae bacterium]
MLEAYEVLKEEQIDDIHAKGTLLRHKKSGARVMLLANDDENKVFNIAFRTPPANSTGVAHIIEHTVLCGSRKFPLKDPFVELVKGSLNTFLNAMTYPDKTMFPVASCNDTDFQNLMDVYLDAVFYPNIYREEKIFRQEGWHYHLESQDAPLTYNGVVYNEMKGAFSSAEEVLDREVFSTLFPDTAYGVESGGDPQCIPQLTYEEFLDFHRQYYHPSNSYIYLYGDMNMEEKLAWLDQEYLSSFDARKVDSGIRLQKPFDKPVSRELYYPILAHEPQEDNTYLSWNMVVGDTLDVKLGVAFTILEYALLDAPGAPVKQALLDAHIGKDVEGSYEDGILQPYFQITAKGANERDKDRFMGIIRETLTKLAEEGINQKALLAGINYFEFRFREADYASYPKGLMYGIDVFDTWLYEDQAPWSYLKQLGAFEELKSEVGSGYFEQLIREYLLDNPHAAMLTMIPQKGLAEKKEEELAEKLQKYKESLSVKELQQLVQETEALQEFQEAEDSEETLECLPLLKRSDISRNSLKLYNTEHMLDGTQVLHHNIFTNGIAYVSLLFDTRQIPDELIPYMGLLKSVIGMVDTQHYTYGELFNEINANTGGINFGIQTFQVPAGDDCLRMFGVRMKCLYDQTAFGFSMIREILTTSRLSDEKRLYEIVASIRTKLQQAIPGAGHASAVARVTSYFSPVAYFQEKIAGISYYRFIDEIEKNFEERKEEVIAQLEKLIPMIFRPELLKVSITADEAGYRQVAEELLGLKDVLYTKDCEKGAIQYQLVRKNEAFKTAGQVQYAAFGGNFKEAGYSYTGAMRVLKVILNYDYLWMNIRVKGGAYGCMSGFRRSGETFMTSYRDPNLGKTYQIFEGAGAYISHFQCSERDMTKYIIGTISELDTPLTPATKGSVSLNAYFSGITEEDFARERAEVLDAGLSDIQALGGMLDAVYAQHNICTIGSAAAIEKDASAFQNIEEF